MLVSQNVPNLINGVSQQADALRYPSQCSEQINFLPSILSGLSKRPPTNHVKVLSAAGDILSGNYSVHKIDRSLTERFLAFIGNGALKVYDKDGNEKTVNAPSGLSYLACSDPLTQIRTLTVADYTFVLNTTKVVQATSRGVAARPPEALVFVKQVRDGSRYAIKLYDSPSNASPNHTIVVDDVKLGSTSTYTGPLVADQGDVTNNLGVNFAASSADALYEHYNEGELFYVRKRDNSNFRIEIECSISEGMAVFKDTVQNFSLLPKRGWADFHVKAQGDPDEDGDDYYVKFVPQDSHSTGFCEGYWQETQAEALPDDRLVASTMPHALINNGSSFDFVPLTWDDRPVGDSESNPVPSFVGQTIDEVLFRKNRLGFLTGENYVLSGHGDFFNFWRNTVIQLLDSDVIDVASGHQKIGLLKNACATSEKIVLFSAQSQFVPDEGELLTPRTLGLKAASDLPSTTSVRPEAIGNSVFFPFTRGGYSGFIDYAVSPDTSLFEGYEITEHCPNYIKGTVRLLAGTDSNALVVKADDEDILYIYKFFRQGQKRVQSSWSKFRFNGQVRGFQFFDARLYVALVRNNQLVLEYMDLTPGLKDTKPDGSGVFVTYLDRRITEASAVVAYNADTDKTTFTLPYVPTAANVRVASRGTAYGNSLTLQSVIGNVVTVQGNKSTEAVWIGELFTSEQELTKPALREQGPDGSVVVNVGRFQVRTGTVAVDSTLDFRVEVTPIGRQTFSYSFASRVVGTLSAVAGSALVPRTVPMRFPVNSKNDQVTIKFINDSYLPCNLLSVDWEALYAARAQRV